MTIREGPVLVSKEKVLIICCYSTEVSGEYRQYLLKIVQYIKDHYRFANKVRFGIVCGGPTSQKSRPGITEARPAIDFILTQLGDEYRIHLREEGKSKTTGENIENAREKLCGHIYPNKHELVVWCNAIHALEIRDLLDILFPDFESSIETHDISRKRGIAKRRMLGTVASMIGVRIPLLAKVESWLVNFKTARA